MSQNKNKHPMYMEVFANHYDLLMNKEKYIGWKKLIKQTVKKYGIPKNNALDVACGTGTMTNVLAEFGFMATGIDLKISHFP